MILRFSHIGPAVCKMDGWMIQLSATSFGQTWEFIGRVTHSALWVFSSLWANICCAFVIEVDCGIEWVHSITSTVVLDTTINGCSLKLCPI